MNTLKEAKFKMMIYKVREGYVSVCYETGQVDVSETFEEAKSHLMNGTIAIMQTIKDGNLLEKAINQKPFLKYRILFVVLPIFYAISNMFDVSIFTEPINPCLASNSAV